MLTSPCCTELLQNKTYLLKFLLSCKQQSCLAQHYKIASISQSIKSVDPLALFSIIAQSNQLNFYLEKPTHQQAIIAGDAAINLTLSEGTDRFSQCQAFISSILKHSITTGVNHLPFTGPHFFASFTFFNQISLQKNYFAPATIFLPKWQISKIGQLTTMVVNILIEPDSDVEMLATIIINQYQKIVNQPHQLLSIYHQSQSYFPNKTYDQYFKTSVIQAVEEIKLKQFKKIVLAQALELLAPQPFNVVNTLNNLRLNHPDCYTFYTSNQEGVGFIGASPERLITIQNNQLETDAIAGSFPPDADPLTLFNNPKERLEHQLVSDFIRDSLLSLGFQPQQLPEPMVLKLKNIQHLWTPIRATMIPDICPLEIVAQLHPTPAVAGNSRAAALEKIPQYEQFDRSLYAAPLGWVDHQGNCEFIVGIRSALLIHNKARLFAGAGIVIGSNPEQELAEIKLKFEPLLKALT